MASQAAGCSLDNFHKCSALQHQDSFWSQPPAATHGPPALAAQPLRRNLRELRVLLPQERVLLELRVGAGRPLACGRVKLKTSSFKSALPGSNPASANEAAALDLPPTAPHGLCRPGGLRDAPTVQACVRGVDLL